MGSRLLLVPLWEPSTAGAGAEKGKLAGVLCSLWVCCGQVPRGQVGAAALQLCLLFPAEHHNKEHAGRQPAGDGAAVAE